MDYKKYLLEGIHNPGIFKRIDIKEDIINNSNRHELSWFCQDNSVTSEVIYNLLDDVGISILRCSDNYLNKINGIISCGKDISNLFDNKMFLEMLAQLDDYYFYLKDVEALKFINYCIDNGMDIVRVFNMLNEESQVYVINNCDMEEYYYELLISSKTGCSKVIIDRISSLDNYDYFDLLDIFEKDISVPDRLLSSSFINKISSIYNVRNYRSLIDKLGKNNDTTNIENLRKKYYDKFLENCSIIYESILSEIKSGVSTDVVLNKYLNCFGGFDPFLSNLYDGKNIDEKLNKSLNYIATDVVVDYVFHDYTSNVFLDINELIRFNNSTHILSDSDTEIYSDIISLDSMGVSEKKNLLDILKGLNMESKFYDDYKCAHNKMVELLNSSIINKDNVTKYMNHDLSSKYGVPICEMNGNPFYVFVKSIDFRKDSVLSMNDLHAYRDCASFSIDGSNKLDVFSDTGLYYTLAYNSIPSDQLIHAFEVDSYSNYYRDNNNIPRDSNGTDRINRLYTPQEIVGISSSYNELVIAQPNENKNDEFNSKLEKLVPFAIYCYDKICENDILSAKNLGLDIILVRTNKYNIDNSNRVSLHSLNDRDICYVKPNEHDYGRRL